MIKRIFAVIIGTAISMAVILAIEAVIGKFYPPPPGTNFTDPQAIRQLMAQMPLPAFVGLLGGYALGSLAGGMFATWTSGRETIWPALITGAIAMIGGIMNLAEIPHPLWFVTVSQLTYVPFAWFGYLIVKQKV